MRVQNIVNMRRSRLNPRKENKQTTTATTTITTKQWQSVKEIHYARNNGKKWNRHQDQGNKRLFTLGDTTSYMCTNICFHTHLMDMDTRNFTYQNIIRCIQFFSMQTKSGACQQFDMIRFRWCVWRIDCFLLLRFRLFSFQLNIAVRVLLVKG